MCIRVRDYDDERGMLRGFGVDARRIIIKPGNRTLFVGTIIINYLPTTPTSLAELGHFRGRFGTIVWGNDLFGTFTGFARVSVPDLEIKKKKRR